MPLWVPPLVEDPILRLFDRLVGLDGLAAIESEERFARIGLRWQARHHEVEINVGQLDPEGAVLCTHLPS